MTEIDRSHLHAIEDRLFNERARLRDAKTPNEIEFRTVQVRAAEREIEAERKFLGLGPEPTIDEILSDDELFAELQK